MNGPDLFSAMNELRDSVRELAKKSDVQDEVIARIEANRKGLHSIRMVVGCTIVGIVLDLGLTVGGAVLYQQVAANTQSVRTVQDRTSTEILCPLYQTLAQAIRANPSPPGLSPDQVELRQRAAVTITNGLSKLGCA